MKTKNPATDVIRLNVKSDQAEASDIKIAASTGHKSTRGPRKIEAEIAIKTIVAQESLVIVADEK